MTQLHDRVATVTERIRSRSHDRRQAYLEDIAAMENSPDSDRRSVSCSNMAHAAAAAGPDQATFLVLARRSSPISASSPPITTCCRRTSPLKATRR